MAEQSEPIRRRVALKLIKPGMDSQAVIARFEAEKQALALMDHPNVAKVFDAGTTEHGYPYFVMEHVPGIALTKHCDRSTLSIEERLELFIQVVEAVQHAHQKGVIHRDIKPSNILVVLRDGQPIPKIIDFGVAKAIDRRLTEKTVLTEQGQLIGTPTYMSPEQAAGVDIDTRTDIYSLGVLLYELLTGTLPFDQKSLSQAASAELLRVIRELEPSKPSTKLTNMITSNDDSVTAVARSRRVDPRTLTSHLRGDLDWITMKALEKDRTRRYASASDLAADIRRHRHDEPVVAGPPSTAYRVRKFVRRNRALVAGSAAVLVALLTGVAVSTWQAVQATQARAEADRQANIAQAVIDFLNDDLLSAATPHAQGRDVTVRQILDVASNGIEGKFKSDPLVEASVHTTLGTAYHKLGEYALSEPHLQRALELRRTELGEEHLDTALSMSHLSSVYRDQAQYAPAEPLFVKAIDPDFPDGLIVMA